MRNANEENWLTEILSEAVRKNWCTRSACTTCGCGEIREAVKRKLESLQTDFSRSSQSDSRSAGYASASGESELDGEQGDVTRRRILKAGSGDYFARLRWTKIESLVIINEISKVEAPSADLDHQDPHHQGREKWNEVVALLLCLSWWALGDSEASTVMPTALRNTYAGSILERMVDHYQRRKDEVAERRLMYSPEAIALRRAERLANRQAEHQRRIAEKALRDRRLILLGEARYGTGRSRRHLFERLVSDKLVRQY